MVAASVQDAPVVEAERGVRVSAGETFNTHGARVVHTLTKREFEEARAAADEIQVVRPEPYYGGDGA